MALNKKNNLHVKVWSTFLGGESPPVIESISSVTSQLGSMVTPEPGTGKDQGGSRIGVLVSLPPRG